MINNLLVKKIIQQLSIYFLVLVPIISLAESANIIQFSDYEKMVGKVTITMTITKNYLRIDDNIAQLSGEASNAHNNFILFDRLKKEIYSVSEEEQQIVKIKPVAVTIPSPIELHVSLAELPMDKAPLIKGKQAKNFHLKVNNKLCYNLVTLPDLLPDAVQAMKDFNQVLAGQQAETLRYVPADLQEPCDLARHTFYPQKHLEKGFPMMIQAIGDSGKVTDIKRSRILMSFIQEDVSEQLFILPDYEIVGLN